MITEDQKNQLEIFTRHERYGRLLNDAIKSWEKITPKQRSYGVTRWNDDNTQSEWQVDDHQDGCCLIGASILGKSKYDTHLEEAAVAFDLNIFEVLSLAYGFDFSEKRDNDNIEALEFGNQVARILFNHVSK